MSESICARCGQAALREPLHDYRYADCGLEAVLLRRGAATLRCPACGVAFLEIPREQQLLQVIALSLLWKPVPLSGTEWRYLRKACGLTQEQAQRGLGRARRGTISDWERKRPGIDLPTEIGARLFYLDAFESRLDQPEQCFLDQVHREQLAAMRASFARLFERLRGEEEPIAVEYTADAAWGLVQSGLA